MKHKNYKKINPLSPDYIRPEPTRLDLAHTTEPDGTGLQDPSGVLARVEHGDHGTAFAKKLTNVEAFTAAARMIRGAGVEVSYRSEDIGEDNVTRNTREVQQASLERRAPNLIAAVVVHGATYDQVGEALADLYSQSENGNEPPLVSW